MIFPNIERVSSNKQVAIVKMAIEIVDLPLIIVVFHSTMAIYSGLTHQKWWFSRFSIVKWLKNGGFPQSFDVSSMLTPELVIVGLTPWPGRSLKWTELLQLQRKNMIGCGLIVPYI